MHMWLVNSELDDWKVARELAKLGKIVLESDTEPRVVSYRTVSHRTVPYRTVPYRIWLGRAIGVGRATTGTIMDDWYHQLLIYKNKNKTRVWFWLCSKAFFLLLRLFKGLITR
jgi:hypothetical protein